MSAPQPPTNDAIVTAPSASKLVSSAAPPVLAGARAVGAAMLAPFVGIGTIASRPSLWPLAITPTVLLVLLWGAGGAFVKRVFPLLVARLAPHFGHGWLGTAGLWLVEALVVFVLVAAVVILAALVVPPLAGPFMDALAGRVDAKKQPDEPFYVGALRGARSALAGMVLLLIPQVILLFLSVVASALSFIWVPLGVFFSALGLGYDALDWPLARRGMGVRARIAWMGEHKTLVLGLGLGASVFALVPGLAIVLLPAIVVGAVRMVNRIEDDEARAGLPSSTRAGLLLGSRG